MLIKLAINARFLTQQVTGVQRYAREIVNEIVPIAGQEQVVLLAPKGAPANFAGLNVHRSALRIQGQLWEQMILPFMTKGIGADILWSPGNIGPIMVSRQVLTIHDAAVFAHPEGYNPLFSKWYRTNLPILAKRVDKIITVSDFSRREIIRYLNIPQVKVVVVPNGVSSMFHLYSQKDINKFRWREELPESFILALGSRGCNKNYRRLLEAWEIISQKQEYKDLWLVTAGGRAATLAGDNPDKDYQLTRIKNLGYVDDSKLPLLYNAADAFIFPSIYEGFGLPPLEAMACGCPVIAAGSSSLPEVCGDAAIYCDPYNVGDMAAKIELVMSDATLRKAMTKKGLKHVSKYTWRRSATKTLELIKQVSL